MGSSHPVVSLGRSQEELWPVALWTDLLGTGSVLAVGWWESRTALGGPVLGCPRGLGCGVTEHPLPRLPR